MRTKKEIEKKLFDMVYMWGRVGVKTDETNYAFQSEVQELCDAIEADKVFEHAKSKECDECQGYGVVPDSMDYNGNVIDCGKCVPSRDYDDSEMPTIW